MAVRNFRRLASGTSALALATAAVALGGKARAQFAACLPTGGVDFVCEGEITTPQDIDNASGINASLANEASIIIGGGKAGVVVGNALTMDASSGTITFDSLYNGVISTNGVIGIGINAIADTGVSITVTGNTSGVIGGINAYTRTGNAEVTTGAGETTGGVGSGIFAYAPDGDVTITTGAGGVSSSSVTGIRGITYYGVTTVTTGGDTSGGYAGIDIYGLSGASVTTGGDVNGGGADGISAGAYDGDVTVDATVGQVNGNEVGIDAYTYSGDIEITTGAGGPGPDTGSPDRAVTGGKGAGIRARTGEYDGGSITIATGAGAVYGGQRGIDATSGAGNVTITTGSGNVTGDYGDGIYARSRYGTGSITITTGIGDVRGADIGYGFGGEYGANGITARSYDGDITITLGGGRVVGRNGVAAGSYGGNVTVNAGDSAVSGDYGGIIAGSEYGDVSITANGPVDSLYDAAIEGSSYQGNVSITTGAGPIQSQYNDAIYGDSQTGDVTIVTGSGDIISGQGLVDYGSGAEAIYASSGEGAISITTGTGNLIADETGIEATTRSGSITIVTGGGEIRAGDYGIYADSDEGDISIQTGAGDITVEDEGGIDAYSEYGNVTIQTGGGNIVSYGGKGIYGGSEYGDVTIQTGAGSITGYSGGVYAETEEGAVTITTGAGDITAEYGDAIVAEADGREPTSTVDVTLGSGTVTAGSGRRAGSRAGNGVSAYAEYGAITITAGEGDIIGGTATPGQSFFFRQSGYGISAYNGAFGRNPDPVGDITITTAGGTVEGGIRANSDGGNVIITTGDGNVTRDVQTEREFLGSNYGYVEEAVGAAITVGEGGGYRSFYYAYENGGKDITITTGAGDVTATRLPLDEDAQFNYGQPDGTPTRQDFLVAGILARPGFSEENTVTITTGSGTVSGTTYGIAVGSDGADRFTRIFPEDDVPSTLPLPYDPSVDITVTGAVEGGTAGIIMGNTYSYLLESDYISGGFIPSGYARRDPLAFGDLTDAAAAQDVPDGTRTILITETGSVIGGEVGIDDRDTEIREFEVTGFGEYGREVSDITVFRGVSTDVTVAGTLEGGALLNGGNDTFTVEPGAVIIGTVDGGAGAGLGVLDDEGMQVGTPGEDVFTDTFSLGGDSGSGSIDMSGFDFDNDGTPGDAGAELVVLGFEEFTKTGGSSFELLGSNDEIGTLELLEGQIAANGTLPGLAVNGAAGTILSGDGTIGTVVTSGTVAPGNSIGTLNVDGDITFAAGSVLEVELGAQGISDLVAATGTASISSGASINATRETVSTIIADQARFTVVTADGGVSGRFGAVTDDVPDITLTDVYDGETVVLVAVSDADEEPPAIGEGDTSRKVLPGSTGMAAVYDARTVAETLRSFVTEGADDAGSGATASSRGPGSGVYFGFGSGFFSDTDVEHDGAELGFDALSRGLMGGVGGVVDTGTQIGALTYGVGLFTQDTDVDNENGSAEIESVGIGFFTGFDLGAWSVDTGIAFADLDLEFQRIVGGGIVASGQTDGSAAVISLEGSYDLGQVGPGGLSYTPYIGLDYVHVGFDGYTETGAGINNLVVAGQSIDVGFARAGVKAETPTVEMNGGLLSSNLQLGLEQAFGDTETTVSAALAALPGTFTERTASIDDARLTLGLGATYTQGQVTTHLRYDGSFGGRTQSHRASVGIDISF